MCLRRCCRGCRSGSRRLRSSNCGTIPVFHFVHLCHRLGIAIEIEVESLTTMSICETEILPWAHFCTAEMPKRGLFQSFQHSHSLSSSQAWDPETSSVKFHESHRPGSYRPRNLAGGFMLRRWSGVDLFPRIPAKEESSTWDRSIYRWENTDNVEYSV